jgi:hypothetical protein
MPGAAVSHCVSHKWSTGLVNTVADGTIPFVCDIYEVTLKYNTRRQYLDLSKSTDMSDLV